MDEEDLSCNLEIFNRTISQLKSRDKSIIKELTIRLLKHYKIKFLVNWKIGKDIVDIYLPHYNITINITTYGSRDTYDIFLRSIDEYKKNISDIVKKKRCPICGEIVDLEFHLEYNSECRKKYWDYINNLKNKFHVKEKDFEISRSAIKSLYSFRI